MPVFAMIPVMDLLAPENPQRTETLMERMDELRDSMRVNGLQQPIGVTRLPDNQYRIIWGHRRSIAATQLQWTVIPAMVYEPSEANVEVLMGAENYHRTQTNDAEEARYYARIINQYPEGTIGLARELNVPQARIERLLTCLNGDPKVFELMAQGKLSSAQAFEINKFESPGYRLQATDRCINEGVGADIIRRWRIDLKRQGIDQNAAVSQETWGQKLQAAHNDQHVNCQIGNHMVPIQFRRVYEICNEHYNVFLEGLEALGKITTLQEAGLYPQFLRLLKIAEGEDTHGNTPTSMGRTEEGV